MIQKVSSIKNYISFFKQKPYCNSSVKSAIAKHIATIENQNIRNSLNNLSDFYSKRSFFSNASRLRLFQIDDIIYKYESCDDLKLKNYVGDVFFSYKNPKDEILKGKLLDFVESVLDASNSANDKYCPVNQTNQVFKAGIMTLLNILEYLHGKKFEVHNLTKEDLNKSAPYQLYLQLKRTGKQGFIKNSAYQNFTKFSPLEELIDNYSESASEIVDYIYQKSYVEKELDPKQNAFYRHLNKKYGVKMLNYSIEEYSEQGAYRIEKELEMFYNLLKPKDSLIKTLKIFPYDYSIFCENSAGYHCDKKIVLDFWPNSSTFRHELGHAVDKSLSKNISKIKLANKVVEENLALAGASEVMIEYAKTNEREKYATLIEYYTQNYPKKVKDYLIKDGIPKEILNLKEIDFFDYLAYKNPEHIGLLKTLRNKLGKIIPQEICEQIEICGMKITKKASRLLPKYSKDIRKDFIDISNKLIEQLRQKPKSS